MLTIKEKIKIYGRGKCKRNIISRIRHSNVQVFVLKIIFQNLQLKRCLLYSSSVWGFLKSVMIVKLQNIRRKNMDATSGKDVKEIVCLLCHPPILSV